MSATENAAAALAPYDFDHGKPFYALVLNYVSLLFGFKELAAQGTAVLLGKKMEEAEHIRQSLAAEQDLTPLFQQLDAETASLLRESLATGKPFGTVIWEKHVADETRTDRREAMKRIAMAGLVELMPP